MTQDEKTRFVIDITEAVAEKIIDKIQDMPKEWDRPELRQYIADKFASYSTRMKGDRLKAYRAAILKYNL